MKLLFLPFILQGICMFVDEFYFHEKRGLKLWEKIGHPVDTMTVLGCYAYLIWGAGDLNVYLVLCGISCLCITKDEFVHNGICPSTEHWLHAILFILHPLSFLSAYLLWQQGDLSFLKIQALVIFIFMFYQALRWSFPWRMQTR
jgi:hypothetical protein